MPTQPSMKRNSEQLHLLGRGLYPSYHFKFFVSRSFLFLVPPTISIRSLHPILTPASPHDHTTTTCFSSEQHQFNCLYTHPVPHLSTWSSSSYCLTIWNSVLSSIVPLYWPCLTSIHQAASNIQPSTDFSFQFERHPLKVKTGDLPYSYT